MLNLGKREGFITKNIEGYAGHLEWGTGEELIGILCHVDVVPEGDHWDMSPYAAEVRDGRIMHVVHKMIRVLRWPPFMR